MAPVTSTEAPMPQIVEAMLVSADPDLLQSVIDRSSLSDEKKALIKSALWAGGVIPSITSAEQHKAYVWVERELSRGHFDPSSPEHSKTFGEWFRSPEGKLAAAHGAMVIEWEERQGSADQAAEEGSQPDHLTRENDA